MDKKQKKMLARICTATLLFAVVSLIPAEGWIRLVMYLIPYGLIGWDVLWDALRNIVQGQVFDENFLMALATMGALALGDYPESVFVMLFYQVGELFQSYAVGRSRKSIAELMDICPEYANLESGQGLKAVDPSLVEVGDVIVIKPGERIPLDGFVLEGEGTVNTAALTGEALPRVVKAGDHVISGCINLTGLLRVKTEKIYEDSTVSRILELVEDSSARKAKTENFITRFARYYTPAVVVSALLLALLPPLIWQQPFVLWLERALTFLVISCPCALVISVPLSFFGGIGAASRQGILIKGGNYLEALARTGMVVFDKTGTLTRGEFSVTKVHVQNMDEKEMVQLAAMAESVSGHPVARSVCRYAGIQDAGVAASAQEISGEGIIAQIHGRQVCVGSRRLMERMNISADIAEVPGTVVHTAVDGVYAGYLVVSDTAKADAAFTVMELKKLGIEKLVMLTGDSDGAGEDMARQLGIGEVYTQLLPVDKVDKVEKLLSRMRSGENLVFVGDGINDAPVLSRADIGIAMGAMGSDAAIEAADVVLMNDNPSAVVSAIQIARGTMTIVWQNILFALGIKAAALLLGALGAASMWAAVFADVGVAVLAILNAMRALKLKK